MCAAMGCEPRRLGDFSKCETVEEGEESGNCLQEMVYSSLLYTKFIHSRNHGRGFTS